MKHPKAQNDRIYYDDSAEFVAGLVAMVEYYAAYFRVHQGSGKLDPFIKLLHDIMEQIRLKCPQEIVGAFTDFKEACESPSYFVTFAAFTEKLLTKPAQSDLRGDLDRCIKLIEESGGATPSEHGELDTHLERLSAWLVPAHEELLDRQSGVPIGEGPCFKQPFACVMLPFIFSVFAYFFRDCLALYQQSTECDEAVFEHLLRMLDDLQGLNEMNFRFLSALPEELGGNARPL
ncbi:MAG: hypothetical protein IJ228_09035 [Succinivibrio sp.]|nr:hypothetical protein [Succinivibrio sp.]